MYIVNKDGTENEVVKAYDECSEEYGYCILCDCCSEPIAFLPECIFLDLMEDGQFKVFVEDEDDSDEMCDCPYCQGFRDGIEASMDVMEVLDDMCDCECGECCEVCEPEEFEDDDETVITNMIREDIQSMLLDLKSEISYEFRPAESKVELITAYEKLYNLIY